MYQWWVLVHLIGVFGLLVSHGVSVGVTFRLRSERDPARVETLLQISGSSLAAFYVSLAVLLLGGIVATFDGNLWGYGWIWGSIATLLAIMIAMYALARPYYRRIRYVATAMAQGSRAVSSEQFDELLRSPRSLVVAAIGFTGLVLILYLMLFKPSLGLYPQAPVAEVARGSTITLEATELAFAAERLTVPADEPLELEFENSSSVPHNVSIYKDSEALFTGEVFTGPDERTYAVPALEPGTYEFRCDVHPQQMVGTIIARAE